jgi:hypothetical protein
MFKTKTKYGFLTTYDKTVFVRQEPSLNNANEFILRCSNIIEYSTASTMATNNNFSNNALYLGKVSLRECFLFLVTAIHGGSFVVSNPMTYHQWTGKRIHNTRALNDDTKLENVFHSSRP